MKKLILFCALAAFTAPLIHAEPSAKPGGHEETELGDKMDAMGAAFKKLRRQINDASANASSLELVARLRKAAEAATELVPAKAEGLSAAEREKLVADYKAGMKDFLAGVDKLEAALKAGDNTAAAAALGALGRAQKEGHREFRKPEKE